MIRKRLAFIGLLLLVATAATTGSILWALYQVPDFYDEMLARQPAPEVRKAEAKQFVQRTMQLVDDIRHSDVWAEEFSQNQVNSWLAEDLHRQYPELIPQGVSFPRVRFDPELIKIGFRYDGEDFKGIVSFQLRPWVPEENQLALEIQSVRAGLIPIPIDGVLQQISQHFETEGWRIEWRQFNGNDVLVLHLDQMDELAPILETVDVTENSLRISGRRQNHAHHSDEPPLLPLADQVPWKNGVERQ